MTAAEKRFRQFQRFLSTASEKEKKAAISIVKVLDQLPNKKQRAEVIKKVLEKLNPLTNE